MRTNFAALIDGPVTSAARVPSDVLLTKLAGGMTDEEVATECGLMPGDLLAALVSSASIYASDQIRPSR
jgi:uncharacterized protein (DUF433 family)